MLLSIFKQDTWDEPIAIMIADYTVEDIIDYFDDFYKNGFHSERFIPLKNILGIHEFSSMKHEDLEKITNDNFIENNIIKEKENTGEIREEENSKLKDEEIDVDLNNDETYELMSDNGDSDIEIEAVDIKKRSKVAKNEQKDQYYTDVPDQAHLVKCSFCNTIITKNNIARHIERMHNKKKRKERNKTSEARQYFDNNESNSKCICKLCTVEIVNKASRLVSHLRNKHTHVFNTLKIRKMTVADQDPKKYSQYYSEIPHDPSKYYCTLCNSAITRDNIKRHIKNMHNKFEDGETPNNVLCSFCGKVFRDKWHRDLHEDAKHKKIYRHICSFCGKGFISKYNLNEHMSKHSNQIHTSNADGNGEKANLSQEFPYVCSKCGKQFMTNGGLNKHVCDGSEGPYQCKEVGCNLRFYSSDLLKRHTKVCNLFSHCREAIQTLTCTKCNIKFSTYRSMKIHCLQSTTCTLLEKKRFQCNTCSKFFTTEKRLTIHLRVHTGEMPFQCNLCLKKFKFKHRLNNHKCLQ